MDWEDAIELKVGLTKEDASFSFQSYHHPVNAIVYTKSPENEKYEIALRLSFDDNEVIDISFLKIEFED